MKRAFVIIALVFILIGTVVVTATFALSGFDFKKLSTVTFDSRVHQLDGDVNIIDINVKSDVRIEKSPDRICRVISYESNRISHLAAVEDGVLKIETEDKTSFYKWWENITVYTDSEWVTLQLPAEKYDSLKIKTLSGDVAIVSDLSYGDVTVNSTSGDIFLTGETDSLSIKSTSGEIDITSLNVNGNADIKTTSGDVEIKSMSADKLQVNSASGDIEVENIKSTGDLSIKTTSGEIELVGCDVGKSILLVSTSGDIGGRLIGEWSFITDTVSGSVSVPNRNSEKECRVKTTSGDIYFK